MINLGLMIIRYTPLLEKLVSMIWSDYEEWRVKYDEEKIKTTVSKALVEDSTVEINKEINK